MYSERGKEMTTMEWYMNAENHAEDYEELQELLEEILAEEEG